MLMGSISHTIVKTTLAPLDRVILLLQCQNELLKQGLLQRPYKGLKDCLLRTMKTDGFRSLWKGNTVTVISYFPAQAFYLVLRERIKQYPVFNVRKQEGNYRLWFASNLLSGGLTGATSLLFVYSLDYTRIRLANDILSAQNERQYKGIVDVYRKTVRTDGIIGLYRKTVRTDGIIGLYRGFPIACAGVVVYRAIYFGLFDSIKHFMPHQHLYATFLLAWGVTTGAALCSYPISKVSHRMMMTSSTSTKYESSLGAIRDIIAKEGTISLFKGAGVSVLQSIGTALVLTGYNQLQTGVSKTLLK